MAFAWQAQYREPPEEAAARLVAAGRRWAARWLLRGRRSTESLLEELLRAWWPLGAAGRRWAARWLLCGRRSTESLLQELLRAWSPLGAAGVRLAFVWQAQYREPPEGAAARLVAAGRR